MAGCDRVALAGSGATADDVERYRNVPPRGRAYRVGGFRCARDVVKESRPMAAARKLNAGTAQLLDNGLFRKVLFK